MKLLAILVILALLAISAGFRKFAGVLVVVGVIGGLSIWQYQEYEENQFKKRILPSDLIFEGVSLEPLNGNYNLSGRIINSSEKYSLTGVKIKLKIKDCAQNEITNCIVISETDEYIYINIPSKQARDFKKVINPYSDIKVKGKVAMDFSIEYAETK